MTIWDWIIIGAVCLWLIYCIAVMIWKAGTDRCMGCTDCGNGSRKCRKCAKNTQNIEKKDMPHHA